VSSTPAIVKFSTKKKFEKKVLVWIAIGSNGASEPLIKNSNYAINADTYLKECVQKHLIPYVQRNYDNNYVFWQDKASSHYANKVVNHLCEEGVNLVEKEDNPANMPEARCIKDF
jgi:hypothetical protein